MSDTWYRDPPDLPPYVDGFGRRWTLDGRCLNPESEREPDWTDEWPEDLRSLAFEASVVMDLFDEYWRLMFEPSKVRGILGPLSRGEDPFAAD